MVGYSSAAVLQETSEDSAKLQAKLCLTRLENKSVSGIEHSSSMDKLGRT